MTGTASLGLAAVGVSSHRLTRHLGIVLSKTITSMLTSGEYCPELNELGFKIEKVHMSALVFIIDRVTGAIICLVASVCVCVRLFVCGRSPA